MSRAGQGYPLRLASLDDLEALTELIHESAHGLSQDEYTREQVDGALAGAFGVDTQLIRDQTYFVVTDRERLVGCGGWSYRATLFGGDARADRDPARLDPDKDAAKVRAFFVHPEYARRGIGRQILAECETSALRAGFKSAQLMATLPGRKLYQACGYAEKERIEHPLPGGGTIPFVPMHKNLTLA